MLNRSVNFLVVNEAFDMKQHGFRKEKSVNSALVHFTESIMESTDQGKKSLVIFVHLSNAFDSISHSILLKN